MPTPDKIYKLADGEIVIWPDDGGAICIKTLDRDNDPVELAEHEALALADLLTVSWNIAGVIDGQT